VSFIRRREMKRNYFAPDDFEVTEKLREWARETFSIDDKEIDRQTEEWHDFEYRRAYSDWTRCWRRWFRQAEKFDTLKREHKPRRPEELTDDQRQADILAFERDKKKWGVS
jgi:hypothetical protein